MSETQATTGSETTRHVALIVAVAAVLSALVALFVEPETFRHVGRGMGGMMRDTGMDPVATQDTGAFLDVRMFLSTYNAIILVALTWIYVSMYRRLPNRFTISLVLFTAALFLYAVSSNPAVHVLFGFRGTPDLGPFVFIPDLFASVAVTTLLYQSYQ
jgi:hypothetical protein